jgi:tryptophan synthase alpha chain
MIKDLKDYIIEKSTNHPLYMPYITAGDPDLKSTVEFGNALIEGGADILEIGIPFSDPTADGPVIEEAMVRAMKRPEYSLDGCFQAVSEIHKSHPSVPVILLTYCNPVLNAYLPVSEKNSGPGRQISREHLTVSSIQTFLDKCTQSGVKGLVIPDLPFDSHEGILLRDLGHENGVDIILLVTPNTRAERKKSIARAAGGFIYYVTSMGVTGERKDLPAEIKDNINEIKKISGIPVFAGFGISTPEQAGIIGKAADGIIVGSHNQKIIAENGGDTVKTAAILRKTASEFRAELSRNKKL